ncbi:MAG: phosphomannomutase/phosphoglucomutase [Nanoarchaeota archaeon]
MDPFKAYDIRGVYGRDITEEFAYKLGQAIATTQKPERVAVGRDVRVSSESLSRSLINGLVEAGVDVVNIGKASTPHFYYSMYSGTSDAGIMITASHNPASYNGFKICLENAAPLYKENGLFELKKAMEERPARQDQYGKVVCRDVKRQYARMFSRISTPLTGRYRILTDTGNGMGRYELDVLEEVHRPNIEMTRLYDDLDGRMPNHEANPVKESEMKDLKEGLEEGSYDFGIGLDGDADRVVFFLPDGRMVPADVITAILSTYASKEDETIVVDVRSSRAVTEHIEKNGRKVKLSIAGHAYIKDEMKRLQAPFGGEKSGHYFYRSLYYTDSPLFTICTMLEVLDRTGETLETLALPLMEKYAMSGEIDYTVTKKDEALEAIAKEFEDEDIKRVDGVSVYAKRFFFNVRKSNTEDILRLNLEADDTKVLEAVRVRIERVIARTSPGFE